MGSSFVVRPALAAVALLATLGTAVLAGALTPVPARSATSSGWQSVDGGGAAAAAGDDRPLHRGLDQSRGQQQGRRQKNAPSQPPSLPPPSYPAYPPPLPPHPNRTYGLEPAQPYFDGRPATEHLAPGRGDRR